MHATDRDTPVDRRRHALEVVYDRLWEHAVAAGVRLLGDRAAAEDVAQEAFARALARWRQLDQHPNVDAWILRVTANGCIDELRRRRREPADHEVELLDVPDRELTSVLRSALGALPRRQREVVVLRHVAGLSEAATAAELGIGVETVKTHAARGLATLRAVVTKEGLA